MWEAVLAWVLLHAPVPVCLWYCLCSPQVFPQIGLSVEEPVLFGSFWWLSPHFPCRFLVVHISPTRTGELTGHHLQGPMRVEGIHMMGFCLVPRMYRLRHCYHYLSTIQPFARCLTILASVDQSPVCCPRTLPLCTKLDFGGIA
jgi:hypothetical protein